MSYYAYKFWKKANGDSIVLEIDLTEPSWVQAIGSVAAILAAFLISWWDRLHEKSEKKKNSKYYHKSIIDISTLAMTEVRYIDQTVRGDLTYLIHEGINTADLKDHCNALSSVTLESLTKKNAFACLHKFRKTIHDIAFTGDQASKNISTEGLDPMYEEACTRQALRAKKEYKELIQVLR